MSRRSPQSLPRPAYPASLLPLLSVRDVSGRAASYGAAAPPREKSPLRARCCSPRHLAATAAIAAGVLEQCRAASNARISAGALGATGILTVSARLALFPCATGAGIVSRRRARRWRGRGRLCLRMQKHIYRAGASRARILYMKTTRRRKKSKRTAYPAVEQAYYVGKVGVQNDAPRTANVPPPCIREISCAMATGESRAVKTA